ncbi:MAG: hypothetical protein AAGA68_24980 [Pseudomonadota bacterium]
MSYSHYNVNELQRHILCADGEQREAMLAELATRVEEEWRLGADQRSDLYDRVQQLQHQAKGAAMLLEQAADAAATVSSDLETLLGELRDRGTMRA